MAYFWFQDFSRPNKSFSTLSFIYHMTFLLNNPLVIPFITLNERKIVFLITNKFYKYFSSFFLFVFIDLQLELFARTTMKFSCEFLSIFVLIGLIRGSLIDYKACQQKYNCTQHLTQADCPDGEFLDTQFKRGCCHGCRKGLGKLFFRFESLKNREKFLKVVEKAAAAKHGPAKNVHRDSNAMKSTFIAFTIDVKRNFFLFFLHVHFHFNLSLSASCLHSLHFDDWVGWTPKCEIDGTYLARQCRGDKLTGR